MANISGKIIIKSAFNNPDKIITLDRRNLMDISIEDKHKGDNSAPSFGLVSNGGSLQFIDNQQGESIVNEFLKNTQEYQKNPRVFLYANGYNNYEPIYSMIAKEWDFSEETRVCNITLTDNLENLQKVKVQEQDIFSTEKTSFWDLMQEISAYNPTGIYNRYSFSAEAVLKTSFFTKSVNPTGSLWNNYNEICKICCLYGFIDKGGFLYFDNKWS